MAVYHVNLTGNLTDSTVVHRKPRKKYRPVYMYQLYKTKGRVFSRGRNTSLYLGEIFKKAKFDKNIQNRIKKMVFFLFETIQN